MDFVKEYDQIEALVESYFPEASEEEVEDIIDGLEEEIPGISYQELEAELSKMAQREPEDKANKMGALSRLGGF